MEIENKSTAWSYAICFLALSAMVMLPAHAHALAGGTAIAGVLCRVVDWFNGPVGRGIATLAIIVIGVGALLGKVSWGMAIIVGVGVAVVFGASTLVDELASTGNGVDAAGCDSGINF